MRGRGEWGGASGAAPPLAVPGLGKEVLIEADLYSEPSMHDPALDFDNLAASIRADARDLAVFLEVIAGKLAGALPSAVTVEHEGGILSRKRVKRLQVQLGEDRYELARAGSGLEGRRSHAVRGITLKTEILAIDEWIAALAMHLAEHARSSESAREALNRLLRG